MDWLWISAVTWVLLALPLALLTGWYLRWTDRRDAATSAPAVLRAAGRDDGEPTEELHRGGRRRSAARRTRVAPPARQVLYAPECTRRRHRFHGNQAAEPPSAPSPPPTDSAALRNSRSRTSATPRRQLPIHRHR